ncbi:MAG: hypothetical protein K0S65_4930, partial [Labilithrix sp.]|nr:hypothetical protein [Labilithrix sp.]
MGFVRGGAEGSDSTAIPGSAGAGGVFGETGWAMAVGG